MKSGIRITWLVAITVIAICLFGCKSAETPTPATPAVPVEKPAAAAAPASCDGCISVTVENFPRAESDLYFATVVKQGGGVGKFFHYREVMPIDKQTVVRANRDTLYSPAVFDLDAGPVTITLPDAGKRFMSMQVLNENEYTPVVYYGKGTYTLTKEKVGTRYVLTAVRTLINPDNPQDLDEVHKLQDNIKASQKDIGKLELPKWDPASQAKVRQALVTLGSTLPDMRHAFGTKAEVNPVRYLIGSAAAWGGNPDKDAIYLNVTPSKNDGTTVYRLTAKNVPVEAFWSISVYNAKGYFEKNPYNAYSLNNVTAKKDPDDSVTVQFGGCDGKIPNCLPIMSGWNYMVRLYRPRSSILNGTWKFPEAQPVDSSASR